MLENLPNALTPTVESISPNQDLLLFSGIIRLKGTTYQFEIEGEIYFKWLPEPRVRIKGVNISDHSIMRSFEDLDVSDPSGQIHGTAMIYEWRRDNEEIIEGIINGFFIGDITIPVEMIRFEVPNFKGFAGQTIQIQSGWMKGRLSFKDDKTTVIIDKLRKADELHQKLKSQGGYCLMCTAELRTSQSITGADSRSILQKTGLFISFLNGRRTLPVYSTGMVEAKQVWKDYSFNLVAPYKDVHSWFVDRSQLEIDRIWGKFSKLSEDEDTWDCIKTAFHWYLEANSNSGFVEGSIVMTHNALELLYHWMILEERRVVVEDESTRISSVNKIRLLLNTIGIPENHILHFTALKNYLEKETMTGPELFVRLRNSIVHPSRKKRQQLRKLPKDVSAQILQVGLWYLEMSLLFMLGYNGMYSNRCSLTVDLVPWKENQNDSEPKLNDQEPNPVGSV